jgi:hypothetical protein
MKIELEYKNLPRSWKGWDRNFMARVAWACLDLNPHHGTTCLCAWHACFRSLGSDTDLRQQRTDLSLKCLSACSSDVRNTTTHAYRECPVTARVRRHSEVERISNLSQPSHLLLEHHETQLRVSACQRMADALDESSNLAYLYVYDTISMYVTISNMYVYLCMYTCKSICVYM